MKTKALKITYGNRVVLDLPELTFEKGKIYSIMGANGSGKSTFAKSIALNKDNTTEVNSIGYMPQKSFAFRMSVLKNMLLTCSDEDEAIKQLKSLNIDNLAKENAKNLSGGEIAKLSLLRVLSKKFDVIILDEPTSPMDVESTLASEKLIKDYAKKNNATVLLITHSKGEVLRISDELLFFHEGKLYEQGKPDYLFNNPLTKEAKEFFNL